MSQELFRQIRIASPCEASWEAMEGDERARYCALCRKHVYNFSTMSPPEVEALVREKEGKVCARFYRRRDGTVLTDNCPVGLRRARRWLVAQMAGVSGVFGIMAVLAPFARADRLRESDAFQRVRHSTLARHEPLRSFFEWVDPTPPPPLIMGAIAAPMPPPGG